MQIILSEDEIVVIHDALFEKKLTLEQNITDRGDTPRTFYLAKSIKELSKIIKRFEFYVK